MNRNRFKERRVQMKLSQARLAEELRLSPRTIARYESGDSKISRRVELAINALESSTLSKSTVAKSRSTDKRPRRVNALRPSQLYQILHVAPDVRSQKNTYTVGFNISLTASPYLIKHLEGRATRIDTDSLLPITNDSQEGE